MRTGKHVWSVGGGLVLACALVIGACEELPTDRSPTCAGGHLYAEPVDQTGDGKPDGLGIGIRIPFLICSIPGDMFDGVLQTAQDGNHRSYYYTLTSGPGAGEIFRIKDDYDAVSVMDKVLAINGYDESYPETEQFRDLYKGWIIENWISADAFYSVFGY